jgi:hypothetical protein
MVRVLWMLAGFSLTMRENEAKSAPVTSFSSHPFLVGRINQSACSVG